MELTLSLTWDVDVRSRPHNRRNEDDTTLGSRARPKPLYSTNIISVPKQCIDKTASQKPTRNSESLSYSFSG